MSFFDALIDLSFKTDADGNNVFYPYGIYFKGRLVDMVLSHQVGS